MLRFIVLTLAAITSAQNRPQRSFHHFDYSVASESQIKNAIENNYDDTGPGAKSPEQAFKTFNNLEDALINYLDDPDTKLPDHERAKAFHRLVKPDHYSTGPFRYLPKITNEYSKWKPISDAEPISILNKFGFNRDIYNQFVPYKNNLDYSPVDNQAQIQNVQSYSKPVEQYKLQSIQPVRSSPVSLAHYSKAPEGDEEYNPNPQYSFSYGVHDKRTGDSKSAHESRDGGLVRGFYMFMDADGKQRTVHYTADDQQGFRATVQRTHGNAQ